MTDIFSDDSCKVVTSFLILMCCCLYANEICCILGYASSSSGAAGGLYNSNTYSDQTYGPKYPYSNQYTGYANTGGSNNPYYAPFAPLPPFATPYDFQNAFQQYYNQLSSFNAKYG